VSRLKDKPQGGVHPPQVVEGERAGAGAEAGRIDEPGRQRQLVGLDDDGIAGAAGVRVLGRLTDSGPTMRS
jgi:hypothetical protein